MQQFVTLIEEKCPTRLLFFFGLFTAIYVSLLLFELERCFQEASKKLQEQDVQFKQEYENAYITTVKIEIWQNPDNTKMIQVLTREFGYSPRIRIMRIQTGSMYWGKLPKKFSLADIALLMLVSYKKRFETFVGSERSAPHVSETRYSWGTLRPKYLKTFLAEVGRFRRFLLWAGTSAMQVMVGGEMFEKIGFY